MGACDTRPVFNRIKTSLNSEFSFHRLLALQNPENLHVMEDTVSVAAT